MKKRDIKNFTEKKLELGNGQMDSLEEWKRNLWWAITSY